MKTFDKANISLDEFVFNQTDGDIYPIDVWREVKDKFDLEHALTNLFNLKDYESKARTFKEWMDTEMIAYKEFLSKEKVDNMNKDHEEFKKVFGPKE